MPILSAPQYDALFRRAAWQPSKSRPIHGYLLASTPSQNGLIWSWFFNQRGERYLSPPLETCFNSCNTPCWSGRKSSVRMGAKSIVSCAVLASSPISKKERIRFSTSRESTQPLTSWSNNHRFSHACDIHFRPKSANVSLIYSSISCIYMSTSLAKTASVKSHTCACNVPH